MSDNAPSRQSFLARYLACRRIVEPGFWIVMMTVQAAVNSWIVWTDRAREGKPLDFWEPAVWESSSHLMLLILVPAVLAFEKRFPLRLTSLRRNLPWHVLASVVFSVVHVAGMVGLRKLAYFSVGASYEFGDLVPEFAYEYLKDVRSYFLLLLVAGAYQLVLLRWQGEASILSEPDDVPAAQPEPLPERFLVRKLGKEFLLPAGDIEWIQAWGNYVNLRVRGHDYPLRATMNVIEQRLDPRRFVRVHRSYIVNLEHMTEIEPLESGDARARLRDGALVPVSRRYRDALRKASFS